MSKTIRQRTNGTGFPKAGELIEITGTGELEARDRAILNVLYQHAHDSGRMAEAGADWELPMVALQVSRHESNDRTRDALDRLMRVVVNVPYIEPKTGEPRILKTHLFDFFDLSADEKSSKATVRFALPKKLQPIIARSEHWGRIRAELVCSMTSKYAIALYEFIQLRMGLDKCVDSIAVDRFRDLMGVPSGKLTRGPDFVRRVIEPALLEVNGLSDVRVDIAIRREKGPRSPITHVDVAWSRKIGDEYRAAVAERQRPKVGRMARLKGQVETAPP